MSAKQALLKEFATKLHFPSYFGENWDAFWDCLTDPTVLSSSSYILVIMDAEGLFKLPHQDIEALLDILSMAAEDWAKFRPNVTFKVVFSVSDVAAVKQMQDIFSKVVKSAHWAVLE